MSQSSTKIRDSAQNAIKRYLNVSLDTTLTLDNDQIENYLKLLEEQWLRFQNAQEAVEISCGTEIFPVEEQARIQTESWYLAALTNFNRRIRPPQPVVERSQALTSIKLPKMELPTFSGKPTEWLSFQDAFESLINQNQTLTDREKLHYLRSCVKGEPLELIRNFEITDANYTAAWSTLSSRYRVMRVIIEHHLRAIFDVEKAVEDSAVAIKRIVDVVQQHVRALGALKRPIQFWDDWLVFLVVSKLSFETRKQWELSLKDGNSPEFDELLSFLETRCRSLELLVTDKSTVASSRRNLTNRASVLHTADIREADATNSKIECAFCNGMHGIYSCEQFLNLDRDGKLQAIHANRLCLNCLRKGHFVNKCRSSSSCRFCQSRHHTLIHINGTTEAQETISAGNVNADDNVPAHFTGSSTFSNKCAGEIDDVTIPLLATAVVRALDSSQRWQTVRVLIDSGSQASFITASCAQRLSLKRKFASVVVSGVNHSYVYKTKGKAQVTLSSRYNDITTVINCLILPKISNDIPSAHLQNPTWSHVRSLQLADPNFATPSKVDILLGVDSLYFILKDEIIRMGPSAPIAQNTMFGYVLYGNVKSHSASSVDIQSFVCDKTLEGAVTKLWEIEEFEQRKFLTEEEQLCEDHFEKTYVRELEGRFVVQLPFKPSFALGESRHVAMQSLLRIERKLNQDPNLRAAYNEFMDELINLDHMELADCSTPRTYYMPHHPVLKETSSTTKLRIVFNASMPSSNGVSLNDILMVGPQLQNDIYSILARFRTHRFAMTADIAKMYRQVVVAEKHRDFQRILWRKSEQEAVRDYRMKRVTYGVAAASHLAVKSLQQTAKDYKDIDDNAAQAILKDFYMDDLLTGASTESALCALQQSISLVLESGGFQLRKWATNCIQLTELIDTPTQTITHFLADSLEVRTLGLIWNTQNDLLSFVYERINPETVLTKRSLLSDASKLFDPLGLIAPCTITPRIWLQKLWKDAVSWDQPVPKVVAEQWVKFRNQLPCLNDLQVPRWIGTCSSNEIELHVFADASERAYAAVVYARVCGSYVTTTLMTARAKVAPLKSVTLPRLELCAAFLAAKLIKQVMSSLNRKLPVRAWTDSTITLAWLQGHPSRWSNFVANRVSVIQETLPPNCWTHVRSEHNPADCASRGVFPSDLLSNELWWRGPSWLRLTEMQIPASTDYTTDLELKSNRLAAFVAQTNHQWELLSRYSSLAKLKRVLAYVIRFKTHCRLRSRRSEVLAGTDVDPLSALELATAERELIKHVQRNAFCNEFTHLESNRPIPLRSPLIRLQPFVDNDGILRVGGRIKEANIDIDVKHPILLPKHSVLAKLLILEIHRITLHAGPRIMINTLQRRFWVIGGRSLVRKIYRSCVKCARFNRMPIKQEMGDLPLTRLTYTRCFYRSGVDYAGPFRFKFSAGRGAKAAKGYICLFICMATGAMHLEFVSDLSTGAFISSFKRFINRRGYCKHIHSDNATNFVGADRELRAVLDVCLADEKFTTFFCDSSVTWHFNPPHAPHMGGYWEVGVKRVKYHLRRSLTDVLLTFEEFTTILTEIEACVNSRPLFTNAALSDELDVLTPGHFLIGEPLKILPEPEHEEFQGSLCKRWQALTAIRKHFWKRWHQEYLSQLQTRSKWFRASKNLEVNDIVLIMEPTPASQWKLGRVIECHKGADDLVRVVTVRTSDGVLVRPVAKLCLVPTKENVFVDVSLDHASKGGGMME